MRFLVVTLFGVLALASPAFATPVSKLSVDNATPSQAAGARTVYKVSFTTSPTGKLSGDAARIYLTLPAGASLSDWTGATVSVAGATVGGCSRVVDPKLECRLTGTNSIDASAAVTITVEGVKNPASSGTLLVR